MSDREALVEEVGLEVEEEEKEQFASNGDHTPLLEFAGEKPQEKATKRVFSAGKIRRHKYTLVKKPEEEGEVEDSKKASEKAAKPKPVSVFKLFRYATALDLLLLLAGTLLSIAQGCGLPLMVILFGDVTNTFINQAATQDFVTPNSSLAALCASTVSNTSNIPLDDFLDALSRNITTGAVDCDAEAFGVTLDELLLICFTNRTQCLSDDTFIALINQQVVWFAVLAVAVLFAGFAHISFFQASCERQVNRIRLCYYRAIMRQDIGWFDSNPSGELSSRLSDDMEKIHDGIGEKLSLFITTIAAFFAGFIIAFVRDYRITLVLLGFAPLLALSGAFIAKLTAGFASQEQKQYASAGAIAAEVLSSIRTVVAFGGERNESKRYDEKLMQAQKLAVKKGFYVGLSLASVSLLMFTVYAVAFWFGAWLISTGEIQGGDVLTVFFAVLIAAFSIGRAAPYLQNIFTAAGAAGSIFETIDRQPPIDSSSEEGLVPETVDSTIQFKDVSFSYPTRPDVQVLDSLSLRVDVGQSVALVGPSGCGKSTVVQLLQRFYDIEEGEILVGGNNVSKLNLKWLRRNIGIVSQEPVLFDTTIAENIRYGREDATMEEIKQAAKSANAYRFISELPDGFDTQVGERGIQLSGGQKQRVAIARALVRDPKILLLDEATSALDTESESVVQTALDRAREGRTTIVIAHRLSTIQNVDVIVSFEEGRVVEMGTHSELMANKGLYFNMVTAQSYNIDETFVADETKNLLSLKQPSDSELGKALQKQTSLQRQTSEAVGGSKKDVPAKDLAEKQKEWDKDLPNVPVSRILRLNAREWWLVIPGMLGAGINGSIYPLFAILFGGVLGVFALPADQVFGEIHFWAGMYLMIGVLSGTATFFKMFCFSVSSQKLTTRIRSKSFRAILRQEIAWFDDERNSSGAITTRLSSDAAQVQGATGIQLAGLIEMFVSMILALGIALYYSWVLTLLILGSAPLLIIAGAFRTRVLVGHAKRNKQELEKAGKVAVDSIENIRTVASLGVEDNFFAQFKENVRRPYRRALFNSALDGFTYGFSQSVVFFLYAAVFRFGAFQIIQDPSNIAHINFQDMFRVFMAIVTGSMYLGQAGAFAPNYAKAKVSGNRIFAVLDRKPLMDSYSEDGDKLENVTGALTVQNIGFRYPSRQEVKVLQDLSVSVKPGQTLALVGPSGCGKSTLVSLIERFYDPDAGKLALDGSDLKELNIQWLRSQIGIVSQEPVLFDSSIADNIRYGANFREVSDEEIIQAAKAANIHSFIESLPQGYNTNVGAKGTQLSGGQKQRVAIARALVRDPKILLLDEATSALDTESEKVVQEALDKAREGRTSIVIAHRLSTIYNADCIAVIKGGTVVERGTHSELLAKKGIYYDLNRFQMIAREEESVNK